MKIDSRRVIQKNKNAYQGGAIVYWMNRDQRVEDNWALLYAQERAEQENEKLIVAYEINELFLYSTERHIEFIRIGLQKVAQNLTEKNIPFALLHGKENIAKFAKNQGIGEIITDFFPLKNEMKHVEELAGAMDIPLAIVDAHNIVPVWEASNKLEFAAYTIRPKILKQLDEFLTEIPRLKKQDAEKYPPIQNDWDKAFSKVITNNEVKPVEEFTSGEDEAKKVLQKFIKNKLVNYAEKRNDPNEDTLSDLSPYLHFGHIAAQRIALEIEKHVPDNENKTSFLEELIVRRELSDNFCYYNEEYDSFEGFHEWAQKTLNEHREDQREYVYSLKQFEQAETHDDLWNAAQRQMVKMGKMHGYMRMYWAKKILEWTDSPEKALEIALFLNDTYSLDGNDPNGFVGVAWSVGGVHDRAWAERDVYGKVRYMNRNGAKRKFDVDAYIEKWVTT